MSRGSGSGRCVSAWMRARLGLGFGAKLRPDGEGELCWKRQGEGERRREESLARLGLGFGVGRGSFGRDPEGDMSKKRMLCSSKHVSCLCRVGMSPKPYGARSPWRSPGPISAASAQRPPLKRPDARPCFPPPPSPSQSHIPGPFLSSPPIPLCSTTCFPPGHAVP